VLDTGECQVARQTEQSIARINLYWVTTYPRHQKVAAWHADTTATKILRFEQNARFELAEN